MSQVLLNCHADKTTLTVGEKFSLDCTGELGDVQKESLLVKRSDLKDDYPPLTLLSFEKNNQKYQLVVTSYRVGEHSAKDVILLHKDKTIFLDGFKWQVQSVIENSSTPPQPFPAFPVWQMSYPVWLFIILGFLLFAIIIVPLKIFKYLEDKKLVYKKLNDLETVFSPIDQLHRDLRKLEKKISVENLSVLASLLEEELKVYLSRRFQIPFVSWKASKCLKILRKMHYRLYLDLDENIRKFFMELESYKKNNNSVSDFEESIKRAQKISEKIENYFESRSVK